MKREILFIINPVSGVGRQKKVEKLIESCLDRTRFEATVKYTEHRGHATQIAREAAERKVSLVVAVGGDGSVNETGQSLIGSASTLAILPAGSGNGLARHLGIPMDIEKALARIQSGIVKRIDTATLNEKIYLGMAGVGFDAHIGWEFARFGKRGFSSYIKVFLREFPKYQARTYEIIVDGKSYHRTALLISVANGSQYGNNASIAPSADITDGQLDVCILRSFPVYTAPLLAYRLFNKSLNKSKYLEIIRGREIRILQKDRTAHIDGEPLEAGQHLLFKIVPSSLNVIC
ncbi:MAG: diacylglycerol kinase family lipid kinase [Bacteroidia bacterium]|nr:diacylglycerol kinase family lipid kinase [Bacteroidia bacterium]